MSDAKPHGYPSAWAIDAVLADGGTVHIRPIRPDDAPAHRAFFARQSEQSVYFRFFGPRSELSDREVGHFTTVDYRVEDVLLRVAQLAEEIPQLAEIDLNPVIASPLGAVAVDVRIRLMPWRRHAEDEVRRLR